MFWLGVNFYKALTYPLPPHCHPCLEVLLILYVRLQKLSKVVGISTSSPLKSWFTEMSWTTVDCWRIANKHPIAVWSNNRLNVLNCFTKYLKCAIGMEFSHMAFVVITYAAICLSGEDRFLYVFQHPIHLF